MERTFIVSKESEYYQELNKCIEYGREQNKVVKEFFDKNNIEATEYCIRGDGMCNRAFEDFNKQNINLYIVPKEDDLVNLKSALSKPLENGLRKFNKSNKLLKEFQQMCIDNKIVINIVKPDVRDYFESLDYKGYQQTRFFKDDILYLSINSECLKEDDTPEGFDEIKLSEFYKAYEEL